MAYDMLLRLASPEKGLLVNLKVYTSLSVSYFLKEYIIIISICYFDKHFILSILYVFKRFFFLNNRTIRKDFFYNVINSLNEKLNLECLFLPNFCVKFYN